MEQVPPEVVAASIRGAAEVEELPDGLAPRRLPLWTRAKQADRWMEFWSAHTGGVRLAIRTAATRLQLNATITRMVPADETTPPFPACVLATVGGVEVSRAAVTTGPVILNLPDRTFELVDGSAEVYELKLGGDGTERDVEIWLPHNGATVIHDLSADSAVTASAPDPRPRWLHHGSSVSHGLEALSPLRTWPQQAASALGLDLHNVALAGNAQLDYFVARAIAATPADIITLKVGINNLNVDSMRQRAFIPALHGFLDVVRDGHPTTPIVVLSAVASPAIEDTPGPTRKIDGAYVGSPREIMPGDGTLTLGIVRGLMRDLVRTRAETDDLLWFSDGLELFGPHDTGLLWDNLHPNQAGYDLIATRFTERANDRGTPLGQAFARVLLP